MSVLLEQPPSTHESRELYCAECNYGIVPRYRPPRCPMCGAGEWVVRTARSELFALDVWNTIDR